MHKPVAMKSPCVLQLIHMTESVWSWKEAACWYCLPSAEQSHTCNEMTPWIIPPMQSQAHVMFCSMSACPYLGYTIIWSCSKYAAAERSKSKVEDPGIVSCCRSLDTQNAIMLLQLLSIVHKTINLQSSLLEECSGGTCRELCKKTWY